MSKIRDFRFNIKEYFIEFSHEFSWQPGDFGDSGSCFFGGEETDGQIHGRERRWMKQHNKEFFCMRMYTAYPNVPKNVYKFGGTTTVKYQDDDYLYVGKARAWVHQCADGRLVLFNAYGESTTVMAQLLANQLEQYSSYKLKSFQAPLHINGNPRIIQANSIKDIPQSILYVHDDYYDHIGVVAPDQPVLEAA